MTLSARIREQRLKHGITQMYLAEILDIPYQRISYMERGRRQPTVAELIAMAKLFGVTLDYLVGMSVHSTEV